MLAARAHVAAAQGHGDEAADWCIVLSRFAGAMPADNLVSGLVNIAIRQMLCRTVTKCQQWASSSPEKTRELMAAVGLLVTDTPLARAFCGERVLGLWIFHSGKYIGDTPKFFKRPNEAEYMRVMRRTVALARKPFLASLDEMDALVRRQGKKSGFFAVVNLLTPALSRAFTEAARVQASLRLLRVSLALRCTRAEGKGLPENLDALVPEYIEKVPLEPFTGAPLLYRRTASGCRVYSVSDDRTDNGGAEVNAKGQRYEAGADIVIEVTK